MKNKTVDISVYIPSRDTGFLASGVPGIIGQLEGVIRARTNSRIKRLLDIEYDPETVSGLEIVSSVKRTGYPAVLIGM